MDIRQMMRQKLDDCLFAKFDAMKALPSITLGDIYELQYLAEAHFYMIAQHEYTPKEIEALMRFHDPLEVAAYAKENNPNQHCFPICDVLDEIEADEIFALAPPPIPSQKVSQSVRIQMQEAMTEVKMKPEKEMSSPGDTER